jgi:hypothetical protein
MSICKNWLCSGISTTTPIVRERTQAQSKQIKPDLFNQFYHKNPLLSLILKCKGGEQKITLQIFVKFSFSLLFHFTYFSFHLYLLKVYFANIPKQGERYHAVIFHFIFELEIMGFHNPDPPRIRTIKTRAFWHQNYSSQFYFGNDSSYSISRS